MHAHIHTLYVESCVLYKHLPIAGHILSVRMMILLSGFDLMHI